MMNKDRYYIAKKDSWWTMLLFLLWTVICLTIGSSITLFDKKINNGVPHRSVDIQNDGTTTIITGILHRYNDDEYMKVKRILEVSSFDVEEKTIQRMSEELSRYELYFNKQVRSQ